MSLVEFRLHSGKIKFEHCFGLHRLGINLNPWVAEDENQQPFAAEN